jgi:hypothetical protein
VHVTSTEEKPPATPDETAEDPFAYEAPDLSLIEDPKQRALWERLTAPFRPDEIELLPKPFKNSTDASCQVCGGYHGLPAAHLSYVGHAGLTMRLNEVDPGWWWEPLHPDIDERALAALLQNTAGVAGTLDALEWLAKHSPPRIENGGIWIRLHVAGIERLGFGDADGKTGAPRDVKVMIGDAIRNAGMRMGIGTYLWSKSEKAKGILERHGSDDERDRQEDAQRRSLPAGRPAERTKAQRGQPAAQESAAPEDPWKYDLTKPGKEFLDKALASDDTRDITGLYKAARNATTFGGVKVADQIVKPEDLEDQVVNAAAVLKVVEPVRLWEVLTAIGTFVSAHGESVLDAATGGQVAGDDIDGLKASADQVRGLREAIVKETD